MLHVTHHSHASHYLLYINSVHCLYNKTALDQLPLPSLVVHSTQQVSWSSSSSTYIGIAPTCTGSHSRGLRLELRFVYLYHVFFVADSDFVWMWTVLINALCATCTIAYSCGIATKLNDIVH